MTITDTSEAVNWRIAYACQALKVGTSLAAALSTTPLQRILEANVCRNYYRLHNPTVIDVDDDVPEGLCKVAPVQKILSDLNGTQGAVSMVPTLVSALLYLAIYQNINRKSLFILNAFGLLCMNLFYAAVLYFYNIFDPRWIYLTTLFSFIGGGHPVYMSVVAATIAESVPQSSLSTFQLHTYAIILLIETLGTGAALEMMRSRSLMWLAVVLALILQPIMILIILKFLQGTINGPSAFSTNSSAGRAYQKLSRNEAMQAGLHVNHQTEDTSPVPRPAEHTSIQQQLTLHASSISVFGSKLLALCSVSLLPIAIVGSRDLGLGLNSTIPYWLSRRYNWKISEVGWVRLGEKLFTALVVCILPICGRALLQQTYSSRSVSIPLETASYDLISDSDEERSSDNDLPFQSDETAGGEQLGVENDDTSMQRDLKLSKTCVFFSAVGTLLLGLSWQRLSAFASLMMIAVGAGFTESYYSFLAGLLKSSKEVDLSEVYMLLSLVAMVAVGIGGWVIAGIYSFALENLDQSTESWLTSAPVWFCTATFASSWLFLAKH